MGTIVTFPKPRQVEILDREDAPLAPDEVRVATLYSGISAGTELTAYRGTNPYLSRRWNDQLRLFQSDEGTSMSYPVEGWGYEEVGRICEVGAEVEDLGVGTIVYGTWGHRSHQVLAADVARTRILPEGLAPILGIFSHMGAIALNGVLDAGIGVGETVAVFGLGVPGQLVAQLAKSSGAIVFGVDPIAARREKALELGAIDLALDPSDGDVAVTIRGHTANRGADVSIEVSGVPVALHDAIRATAYSSRVVALGFFQGEAVGLRLGEEFHHNRVNVVSSQISGVAPERSNRWNRERLVRTGMELQARGVLNLRPLISHVMPYEQAAEAFRMLDEDPSGALQVVLETEEARA